MPEVRISLIVHMKLPTNGVKEIGMLSLTSAPSFSFFLLFGIRENPDCAHTHMAKTVVYLSNFSVGT